MKKIVLTLCLLIGFFYQNALWAQPANDNCADAIAIGEVTDQDFSTFMATTDGLDHENDCVSTGTTPATTYNDIWYLYTATFTGQAEWTFCGTGNFDTKIFVYDGNATCPPTDDDIVACNEDGPGCADATSVVVFDVVANQTYLLRVGGYGDGEPGDAGSGTFTLHEYIPPVGPDNDNCADAEEIAFGDDIPFNNEDAITDGPEHPGNPCFGFGDNTVQADIWYFFTATFTGSVEWSTCNMTLIDTRLAVYTGGTGACPFTDADLYACNDDGGGCADFTSYLIFDVIEGETYHLRLGGYDGATGDGFMSLNEIIPPEPPINDLCENPIEAIIVSEEDANDFLGLNESSTIASSFDSDQFIFPSCLLNTNGGEFGDVWFKFNSLGNTDIEVRFNSNTELAEYYFDIWDNCDTTATATSIVSDCFYFDGTNGGQTYFVDTIVGLPDVDTEYYIHITTRFTSDIPGEFWFQLVADTPTMVSVDEGPRVEQVRFYPNPTKGAAELQFSLRERGEVAIEIVNILGQAVLQQNMGTLTSGTYNLPLSLSKLEAGVYFLSIKMDNRVQSLKFVKE